MTAGIKPIEPYPMLGYGDLPADRVEWAPHPDRAALLVHDMQDYFLRPFPADRAPRVELTSNIAALRETCAQAGVPVLYTMQPGSMTDEERGLQRDFWGPGMRATPADRAVPDELAPRPGDVALVKWRYSAFHRTGLLDVLREAGRDQLIICGVYAHLGCLITAIDAYSNDIQPFFVPDAVADFSAERHRMAVSYAAASCAAIPTTKQVLDHLRVAMEER